MALNFTIQNIVLHRVIRENNATPTLQNSDALMPKSNAVANEFVEKLIISFKNKRPTYGSFQNDEKVYPFQTLVKTYISKKDFLDFTINSMRLLKKEIDVPSAKGGYVVFVHYEMNNEEFLSTVMLEKATHFGVDDNSLDLTKLSALDLEKLARGNRLNITKWQSGNKETYLAFIKGTRNVSSYFQKFIGNTDLTSAKVNSKSLKDTIQAYMRDRSFDENKKGQTLNKVYNYLFKQHSNQVDVELSTISSLIDAESPHDFLEYIDSKDNLSISDNFRLSTPSDFIIFKRKFVVGDGYKLEFDNNLVKEKKIVRSGNDIVIKNVSVDILDCEFGKIQ